MTNEFLLFIHIGVISLFFMMSVSFGKEALVTFTILQMICAHFFVIKLTTLFGFQATTADAFVVGSLLGLNALQELYGKPVVKRTIVLTFIFSFFYAAVAFIQVTYIPHAQDWAHNHFEPLLRVAPWLVGGSIFIFMTAQMVDMFVYGVTARLCGERLLLVRNYIALMISQLYDTILFSLLLRFLGVVTTIYDIIVVSYSIKMLITLIATPCITGLLALNQSLRRTVTRSQK